MPLSARFGFLLLRGQMARTAGQCHSTWGHEVQVVIQSPQSFVVSQECQKVAWQNGYRRNLGEANGCDCNRGERKRPYSLENA